MPERVAIIIGADHAGIELKAAAMKWLESAGYVVEDVGAHEAKSVDYPDFAHPVARRVVENPGTLGILICGTGVGMSIAANRHTGVRAAVCSDTFSAKMARATPRSRS